MSDEQAYPVEELEQKRAEFEQGIKKIAVERFGYSGSDAMLEMLTERNRNGRYAVEWVRGAWEGFNMARFILAVGRQADAQENALTYEAVAETISNGDVGVWTDGVSLHADNNRSCAFPVMAGRRYRVTVSEAN